MGQNNAKLRKEFKKRENHKKDNEKNPIKKATNFLFRFSRTQM